MHGDDDDNSSFPVSVNYSSALLFLLLANISGLLFVCFLDYRVRKYFFEFGQWRKVSSKDGKTRL